MTIYRIVRIYKDGYNPIIMAEGLTLAQAYAWRMSPKASWRTALTAEGKDHTERFGPWYDLAEPDPRIALLDT